MHIVKPQSLRAQKYPIYLGIHTYNIFLKFPITNFMQLMLNYLQSVTIELSTNRLVARAIWTWFSQPSCCMVK